MCVAGFLALMCLAQLLGCDSALRGTPSAMPEGGVRPSLKDISVVRVEIHPLRGMPSLEDFVIETSCPSELAWKSIDGKILEVGIRFPENVLRQAVYISVKSAELGVGGWSGVLSRDAGSLQGVIELQKLTRVVARVPLSSSVPTGSTRIALIREDKLSSPVLVANAGIEGRVELWTSGSEAGRVLVCCDPLGDWRDVGEYEVHGQQDFLDLGEIHPPATEPSCALRGIVCAPGGQPLAGVVVRGTLPEGVTRDCDTSPSLWQSSSVWALTNSAGRFVLTLPHTSNSEVTLYARPPEGIPFSPAFLESGCYSGGDVRIVLAERKEVLVRLVGRSERARTGFVWRSGFRQSEWSGEEQSVPGVVYRGSASIELRADTRWLLVELADGAQLGPRIIREDRWPDIVEFLVE